MRRRQIGPSHENVKLVMYIFDILGIFVAQFCGRCLLGEQLPKIDLCMTPWSSRCNIIMHRFHSRKTILYNCSFFLVIKMFYLKNPN